jgi:hypothetical protein
MQEWLDHNKMPPFVVSQIWTRLNTFAEPRNIGSSGRMSQTSFRTLQIQVQPLYRYSAALRSAFLVVIRIDGYLLNRKVLTIPHLAGNLSFGCFALQLPCSGGT